jgi:hypothetical protein
MAVLSKTALKAQFNALPTPITRATLESLIDNMVDSNEDVIPQLTTAQINALTPTLNQLVFNTDKNYVMQYNGTIWVYLVAMFIGDTAAIAASTPKEGQLFYNTTTKVLSFGDGVTHEAVQKADACTCVQTVKVSLSSAQILNSFTTPVQLIAAPGAGKSIVATSYLIIYPNGTTAYATNTTGYIAYDTDLVSDQLFGNFNLAIVSGEQNAGRAADVTRATFENKAIFFKTDTGNPTAGDGTIDLYITYQVITL